MKQIRHIFKFCLVVSILPSCIVTDPYPYYVPGERQRENFYYVPVAANVPLLTSKDDASLSLNGNISSNQFSGSIQAAWLPTNHFGVMMNYQTGSNESSVKFNNTEAGIGYVKSLSPILYAEVYGGLNTGTIRNMHHTGSSLVKNNGVFIQPALFIHNKQKNTQLAFVSRFNSNKSKIKEATFDTDREPENKKAIESLQKDPKEIYWEPSVVFRFGWKDFLFHSGYSYSTSLSNSNIQRVKGNFSLGVSARISKSK